MTRGDGWVDVEGGDVSGVAGEFGDGEAVLGQVTYRYPDRDTATLDSVSLTLPTGSITAEVGENGSGKSTLMKILSGMLLPEAGTLRWGDADLTGLDRSQVFERVSLLAQDFQRASVTAAMNIRLGCPDYPATDRDLKPSVDSAVAGPVTAEVPDVLRSLLARTFRGAIELSGGE
ncbi:ATP-binding cassette domain-containing protein [Streptomyces flaveolus]|uniref:ATP-binding cassette domain-containing protein n=1 Tax=Streptomyces flaveolus TaxID=67297 RepID=UPI0037024BE1